VNDKYVVDIGNSTASTIVPIRKGDHIKAIANLVVKVLSITFFPCLP
jgi:hypothetical protein